MKPERWQNTDVERKLRWRHLALFFPLALFAWTIWIPQAAHKYGLIGWAPSQQSPLNVLTVWSPGLAAVLLTGLTLGRAAVGDLFRGLLLWRVPLGWYALALLIEPARWAAALGIDRLMGQNYVLGPMPLAATLGATAPYLIPVAIVLTLPNSLGEELGWRAFALRGLLQNWGAIPSSVIIGLYWGLWHIPMWLYWSRSTPGIITLLLMVVNFVPVSMIFTLLYLKTNRSLLLICLLHASMAGNQYLCPRLPTWTGAILLWGIALVILARGGLSMHAAKPEAYSRQAGR